MNPDFSANTLSNTLDRTVFRKMMRFLLIALFLLSSLYIFVIAPLYVWVSNDVLYMYGILPNVFEILNSAIYVFVFGAFYGTFLYALFRFSLKKALPFLFVYIGSVFYRNIGNLLMTYITDGFIADAFTDDLYNIALLILLDLLQTAVVVFLAAAIIDHIKKCEAIRMEAARVAKKQYISAMECLPFSSILSMKNPLQKTAFWMASVPMLVHILQRAYYDIFIFATEGFYDDPLIDILWMILYYSIDIIAYGIIVYFIEIFLVSHFGKTESAQRSKSAIFTTDDDLLS